MSLALLHDDDVVRRVSCWTCSPVSVACVLLVLQQLGIRLCNQCEHGRCALLQASRLVGPTIWVPFQRPAHAGKRLGAKTANAGQVATYRS